MRPTIRFRALTAPPTAATPPLTAFRLRRSLAWPVGQAEAEYPPQATPPAAGEKVVAEGSLDGSSYAPLFTGQVLRSRQGVWQGELLAEEATGPLARLYVEKVLSGSSAAKAIQELCDAAGVARTVQPPGAQLPQVALLSNQTALDHILRLATLSGMLVRTDVHGKLHAGLATPAPSGAMLRPQDPVLDFQVEKDPSPAATGTLVGDGAYGTKGAGTEEWVLQSLAAIKGGSGLPLRPVPTLKLAADVVKLATAEAMRLREGSTRIAITLGTLPPADLGEVILLQGFAAGNGPARVVAIEVLWGASSGLLCRLDLHGVGG